MTATDEPATTPVPGLNATEQRRWEATGQLRLVTPAGGVTRRQPAAAFLHAALALVPHRLRDAWQWPNRPPAATKTARSGVDRAVTHGDGQAAGTKR